MRRSISDESEPGPAVEWWATSVSKSSLSEDSTLRSSHQLVERFSRNGVVGLESASDQLID